jgi:hypothetical protein
MNQLGNMGFVETQIARMAIHHFVTLGNSIALFKGGVGRKDISSHVSNSEMNSLQQDQFWKGVADATRSGLSTLMSPTAYTSAFLVPLFDSITVDEVQNLGTDLEIQSPILVSAPIPAPVPEGLETIVETPESLPITYQTPVSSVA